jgi:RHS repeat-associated protein
MRQDGAVTFLLADHLGSTSVTTDSTGVLVSSMLYTAFGETRTSTGMTASDYRYTGQREESEIGLYYYNARFYDAYLNRFLSPDTIIPDQYNPIDWDRYSYARNNPIRYSDPSGHDIWDTVGQFSTGFVFEFAKVNAWYSMHAQEALTVTGGETNAMIFGRIAADVATIYLGVLEFNGGITVATGGTIAGCAGTACVASPAAIALGAGVAAVGVASAASGAIGLGGNLAFLTGGSGSSIPGFASTKDLTSHFLKHGSEFGFKTKAQYLKGAQDFVATKGDKGVLVKVRANGDTIIYNPTTNEFAVTRSNGTIKTYLKPDPAVHKKPTNLDYFISK